MLAIFRVTSASLRSMSAWTRGSLIVSLSLRSSCLRAVREGNQPTVRTVWR